MAVNGNVYTVTTPLDNVPGSLRSAINDANIDGTGGLITVACSGPIVLQSPLPQIYCDSLMIIIAGVQLDGGNVCTDPAFEFSTAHSCASLSPNSAINFIPRVFSVFSSDDSGPGTLRDIINAANFSPSQDIIHFNLSGPAPRTIQLNSALPQIIYSLEINGASQPLHGYIGSALELQLKESIKHFQVYGLRTSMIHQASLERCMDLHSIIFQQPYIRKIYIRWLSEIIYDGM